MPGPVIVISGRYIRWQDRTPSSTWPCPPTKVSSPSMVTAWGRLDSAVLPRLGLLARGDPNIQTPRPLMAPPAEGQPNRRLFMKTSGISAALPAQDLRRAKTFYNDRVGLQA